MPSPPAQATVVAHLTTDEETAVRLQDALAEICDGETVAITIAQEPQRRWSLALHFRDRPDEPALRGLVASVKGPAISSDLVFEELAPTDWVRVSLEGLKPVEAGRFVVHGAHDRSHVGVNRIAIQIEAGLAFGTGHHGSTRGCLLALDRIMKREGCKRRAGGNATSGRRNRKKAAVLDIGTGTGVLAVAAAKALHRRVVASDIDARAVATARDNARINRVAGSIEVVHAAGIGGRRILERSPFALILANILLDPLKQLATPIASLVAPNGQVVLSGLLHAQGAAAAASYRARGLALAQRIALGGWTTLLLVRPSRRPARAHRGTRCLRKRRR
jgi:ribosomal protein L11 methyltransferase